MYAAQRAAARGAALAFEGAFEGASTGPGAGEGEADADVGDDGHEAGAASGNVFGKAGVEVGCPAGVVGGVLVRPVEMQQVDNAGDGEPAARAVDPMTGAGEVVARAGAECVVDGQVGVGGVAARRWPQMQ